MARHAKLLLMLLGTSALQALAPTVAAGHAPAAAAFGDRQPVALDGSADAADEGDFEFDLDVSSKHKLKRLHQKLDGADEDDTVEVVASAVDDVPSWTPPLDYSTKVEPSGFNYGRGTRYVAAQDVLERDVLFSVPFVDVMNVNSARQGRIKALLDANPDLPMTITLAVHLLEERFLGEASRFHEYIDTLPRGALNSTLFYTEEEMAMLRGSHLYRVTTSRVQAINGFFDALVGPVTSPAIDPPLFTKEEFTQENFAWAMGMVWARAFSPTGDDNDAMLAPIFDTVGACVDELCPPSRIEWDRELQRVVVYATQDYAAGEEVLVNFGDHKSTTLLMLNHGFARAQPYTQAETFDLSIFLDPNDTLIAVKSHLLETRNMSLDASYTLRYKSKQLDATLVKSLKFKLLSAAELDKYAVLLDAGDEIPIVSLRNEYVFTRAVVSACKNLLANYPTTLAHDRAKQRELEAHYRDRRTGVADRQLHILRALVVEKEILTHAVELATARWGELLAHADPAFLGA